MRLIGLVVLALGLTLAPLANEAQQAAKVARIGWLGDEPTRAPHLQEAFLHGLRDLGYVEGRNLVVERRYIEGKLERLPAVATELGALKLDVIVAVGTPYALAAKQATRTIPIVFPAASDPVTSGLVSSFARPGGNVTGLSFSTPAFLKELNKPAVDTVDYKSTGCPQPIDFEHSIQGLCQNCA